MPKFEQTLKEIEKVYSMHPSFKSAISKMYGYTSDESGIRHALIDDTNVDYADALYMLVICSAFINYLILKVDIQA